MYLILLSLTRIQCVLWDSDVPSITLVRQWMNYSILLNSLVKHWALPENGSEIVSLNLTVTLMGHAVDSYLQASYRSRWPSCASISKDRSSDLLSINPHLDGMRPLKSHFYIWSQPLQLLPHGQKRDQCVYVYESVSLKRPENCMTFRK